MPFIDTSSLEVVERLPGWYGCYFHSPSMTFALSPNGRHGAFVLGAVCEETSIALEIRAATGQLDLRRLLNVANPLAVYVRDAEVKPVSIQNEPDRDLVGLPGLAAVMGKGRSLPSRYALQSCKCIRSHKLSFRKLQQNPQETSTSVSPSCSFRRTCGSC